MSRIYDRLGEFQEKFRNYLLNRLAEGNIDPRLFDIAEQSNPGQTLEFREFRNIVLKHREIFRDDFGAKVNNLPTWLDDLREIRNKVAHYSEVTHEDENLAEILMKRISNLAHFTIFPQRADLRETKSSNREKLVKDPVLDSILRNFPGLQVKTSHSEYRVYRDDGSGNGSIWIMPQKSGYAVVTTGKAQRLDSDIEKLTGMAGKEMSDRPYKRWTSVMPEAFTRIFELFDQI